METRHRRTAHSKRKRWLDGYGAFKGGDPRLFTPDPDASTEEERKAHRKACEEYERSGGWLPEAHRWETADEARKALREGRAESAMICGAFAKTNYRMFGLGGYRIREAVISRRVRRLMRQAWDC